MGTNNSSEGSLGTRLAKILGEHRLDPYSASRFLFVKRYGYESPSRILKKLGTWGYKKAIKDDIIRLWEPVSDELRDPEMLTLLIKLYADWPTLYRCTLNKETQVETKSQAISTVLKRMLLVPPRPLRRLLSRVPVIRGTMEQADRVYDDAEYFIDQFSTRVASRLERLIKDEGQEISGLYDPEIFIAGSEAIREYLSELLEAATKHGESKA